LALAVLGYAAFANAPGVAFIATLFTGSLFFAAWAMWYLMRRAARSRRSASRRERAR